MGGLQGFQKGFPAAEDADSVGGQQGLVPTAGQSIDAPRHIHLKDTEPLDGIDHQFDAS